MTLGQMRSYLVLGAFVLAGAVGICSLLQAADQTINLDQNSVNGSESKVSTKVLQTYPVKIENTVYNNAPGEAFNFSWSGAGPGGFSSFLAAGPGVGTIWTWTTVYQVYSLDSPITFTPVRTMPVFGSARGGISAPTSTPATFMVPGKSTSPTAVTLSSASLTSSLITFFSPEKTVTSCGVDCASGNCEIFLENKTGQTVTLAAEQQDCCYEPHQIFCEGVCTSYLTDDQNCGGCGNACASDQYCAEGACENICPDGQILCGETCVDPSSDELNCGGCGTACAADEFCGEGACEPICPGRTLCGTECVDTSSDRLNCGGCGQACGEADYCDGGVCQPICNGTVCGANCVDVSTDPLNCGGCGNACAYDEYCGAGACQDVCPGQLLCGTACVNPSTDPLNCGACGNACGANAHCDAGTCTPNCPGTVCGASCVNLASDPLNCGACGNVCAANNICTSGQCVRCKSPTQTACNNVCVNVHTDPYNCGSCGHVCDFSGCPSSGQGSCSQGDSCVCAPGATTMEPTAIRFQPTPSVTPMRLSFRAQSTEITSDSRTASGPSSRRSAASGKRSGSDVVAAAGTLAASVQEAPVCSIDPISQVVPDGGRFTQSQPRGRFGKEIQTTISIVKDGQVVAQGPCPMIVPVTGVDTSGVILSPVTVATRDASGDSLCQPGEAWCEYRVSISNVGDSSCINPLATLSSQPDQFNPNQITFLNASSPYDNLPAYPGDQQPLETRTNTAAFTITTTTEQAADVGRIFNMTVTCTNRPDPIVMPLTLGIGTACNPNSITGESYDSLNGFQSPVNAKLTQEGPVEYSTGKFNSGKTIPFKVTLGCGGRVLRDADLTPNPQIVGLVHSTLGAMPLTGINGDNNANPDDPGFSCSDTGCDYQFRTAGLPIGTYVISVKMPDSRVFKAGFTIRP